MTVTYIKEKKGTAVDGSVGSVRRRLCCVMDLGRMGIKKQVIGRRKRYSHVSN